MGPHRQLIEFRTLSHSAVLQQLSVSDSEYDTLRGIIEHELSQDSTAIPKYNFKTTVGKQSLINFIQTTLSREKLGRRKRSADLSWERLLLTVGMRTIRNARKRWIRAKHGNSTNPTYSHLSNLIY